MLDVSKEIRFQTARSGGKGGQNVNKVETMVEGYFDVRNSAMLTAEEKDLILKKLKNKINSDGFLLVKSQEERSQLGNKHIVIKKLNSLLKVAMSRPKKRRATKPSRAAKERRLESKKKVGDIKSNRKKISLS